MSALAICQQSEGTVKSQFRRTTGNECPLINFQQFISRAEWGVMLRRLCLIAGIGCLTSMNLVAQQSGAVCLHGYTMTSTGEPAANASIMVTLTASGIARLTESDASGAFEICNLAPGRYQIVARHDQLVSRAELEDLSSGQDFSVRIAFERREQPNTASRPSLTTPDEKPDHTTEMNIVNRVELPEDKHIQEVGLLSGFTPSASANIPDAPSSSKRNQPHGLLYGYLGSSLMNQTDLGAQRAELPLSQYGGALGGAIGSGRTSYFVSFDRYGINRQMLLSALAQQVGVSDTTSQGDANVLVSSALVSRVDRQFSSRDSGYLRFDRNEMHGNSLQRGQDANLPSVTTGLNLVQQNVAAGNTVNLSPNTTNETRAQFISTDVQVPAGAEATGLQSTLPTDRHNRVFEAANNVYRQVGGQSLRMGGDFLYNQMNISFMQAGLGRIASGPSLSQSDRDAGLYVQSQRQLQPNLVLTTGVRYDVQALRGRTGDMNNFSPQVGFAWSPGSSRTVIRGGFGMYYDRVPLPVFFGSADPAVAANLTRSVAIHNPSSSSFGDLGTFTAVSPTIQNSYAENASLQAEQQIGNHSVLSAEYQYVRGVQLALPVRRTASLCASTATCNGGNEFTGQQVGTGATSSYSGISVAFTQQPVRWGNYKVSYTYSAAEGSGTGTNTSYIADQMRRVSFTGVLHTSLDPGTTLWQRATHGFMLAGTTDYYNRSEFLGMNFINFNARLSKNLLVGPMFRLEAIAETFNMLQRTNAAFMNVGAELGKNATEIISTYQRVASAQSPNGSQIGLRMTF